MNFIYKPGWAILLLICIVVACSSARETVTQDSSPEVHDTVAGLIAKMPVQDPEEQQWINEQLLETDSEGIRILSGILNNPSVGDDTHARYAISSLAQYVSAPGRTAERSVYESALLDEIRNFHSTAVKSFLMEQLKLIGSDRSVPELSRFLNDDKLYRTAIDVLVTIRSSQATRALREAAASTDGEIQNALIKALGEIQDEASLQILTDLASSEHWNTRRMALYALANIGSLSSENLFAEAYEQAGSEHRDEIERYYLNYAEKLASQGYEFQSSNITRGFLDNGHSTQIERSALSTLFIAEGSQLIGELLEIAATADLPLGRHALNLANRMDGLEATNEIVSKLVDVPDSRKPVFITILGKRGDSSVVPHLEPYKRHSNREVRVATVKALHTLEGDQYLPEILIRLKESADEEELSEIESILMQIPSTQLIPSLVQILPEANNMVKPALIRIIGHRRAVDHLDLVMDQGDNSEESVRIEVYRSLPMLAGLGDLSTVSDLFSTAESDEEIMAIQTAIIGILNNTEVYGLRRENILDVLNESGDEYLPYLLQILPNLEIDETLPFIRETLSRSNSDIRSSSVRALADWPGPAALSDLLEAAEVADESDRRKLYEGYVRIVNHSGYSSEHKALLLYDLLNTAGSTDEETVILGCISNAEDLVILKVAGSYVHHDNESLKVSGLALISSVLISSYEPGSDTMNISSSVLAILDESTRSVLIEKLERAPVDETKSEITVVESDEEVMAPVKYGRLFNGFNLDGWEVIGDNTDSWGAEDGILYTDGVGSGWLSTTSVYDNFRLELEYRVPEEGNSGVFLRAPRRGNPAYEGMEIQILDDYADRYAELHPWQYTGSIYDIKSPSKRVSKRAGEWQKMVIETKGPDIRVHLNGELIVNTNLINHMEQAERHPGIKRRSGYIGLQNHSNRVEFRNIIINQID